MRAGRDLSGESERQAALLELDLIHGEAFSDLDRLVSLANEICGANLAAFTVHDEHRAYQVSTSFGSLFNLDTWRSRRSVLSRNSSTRTDAAWYLASAASISG